MDFNYDDDGWPKKILMKSRRRLVSPDAKSHVDGGSLRFHNSHQRSIIRRDQCADR
jgi:hypothetical protein